MSNEENENQTVESTVAVNAQKSPVNNMLAIVMDLKEKNPKVFFGAVGGVVLLLIIMMMSGGGGSGTVSGSAIKNLSVGQKYVLKSANGYEDATIRLVSAPGTIAAYDDTEEADRSGACQHMPQNTPVTVVELQDAYGKKNAYAKVRMEDGECKGNEGWALSIDVR